MRVTMIDAAHDLVKRMANAWGLFTSSPMKYTTRLNARQVILAFDLYIKRLLILASENPGRWVTLRKAGLRPPNHPTPLPANLSLKAIAARCRMSTSKLTKFIDEDFRLSKFKRKDLVKFVQKHYRP